MMNSGNLSRGQEGIWFSSASSAVSYPASGNESCFAVEDQSFWFRHRNDCIIECLRRFPPAGAVFDVGGGNGFVALALQRSGVEAVLVEPGLTGARNARRRGLSNVICSTLEDAHFQPGTIPAIGMFDVLEHIAFDHAFLLQVREALQPGGRLYLTVPAYGFLWSADDDFAGHVRRYTRASLMRDLIAAGYAVDYCTYFFAPLPVPILLTRTLPSVLKLRNSENSESGTKQHVDAEKVGRLLRSLLNWERRTIANGGRIPFGSSCLVAARSIT